MSCCPTNNIYPPLIRDCSGVIRNACSEELILVAGSHVGSYEWVCPGGRLSLSSSDPLPATITASTTVYYLPYKHNKISLYNGSFWRLHEFTSLSLALPSTMDTNYDVFLFLSGNNLILELEQWTSDTARNVAITTQDGVWVKDDGDFRKRYLGSVRTGATLATAEDSIRRRFLFNQDNREWRRMLIVEGFFSTPTWTYSSTTVRQLNNDTAAQFEYLVGHASDILTYHFLHITGSVDAGFADVGFDNDSSNNFGFAKMRFSNTEPETKVVDMNVLIPLGYHFYTAVEAGDGVNTWSVAGTGGLIQIRGQTKS